MIYSIIKNDNDILNLMEKFGHFHDSCIKEMHYLSGGWVDQNLVMYPFNDLRSVSIIFQRQGAPNSVIELVFMGINKLNLEPRNEEYDCIIYGASLKIANDIIYWSEYDDFDENDLVNECGTWISARQVMWRELPDALGNQTIFINSTEQDGVAVPLNDDSTNLKGLRKPPM